MSLFVVTSQRDHQATTSLVKAYRTREAACAGALALCGSLGDARIVWPLSLSQTWCMRSGFTIAVVEVEVEVE